MNFNYGQYARNSVDSYMTSIPLTDPQIDVDESSIYYDNLSLSNPNTYYFQIKLNAIQENVKGTLYIKLENSTDTITLLEFNLPIINFSTTGHNYMSVEKMKEAWQQNDYEDGSYCLISDSASSDHGNIYIKPSLVSVGNINSNQGFPSLKTIEIEKIITLRTNLNIEQLGISFVNIVDNTSYSYKGCSLMVYTLQELMNNSNYIPYTKIRHLGIQGKSGMNYCINGDVLILTNNRVEEHFSYDENNPIFSIKVLPKDNFFLIDYEYMD